MTDRPAPRRVVVAGGGTAGWVTATALARQLGSLVEITLVESEEIGTIGVGESTIPTARAFHEFLKIDQQAFMRASRATFKLAISFENWARDGDRYLHSFGTMPMRTWMADFQHFWLEARARGEAGEIGQYYLEHEAARLHRMDLKGDPKLNYAYHLDASLYAKFLRRIAENDGVTRIEGKIANVERDGESGDIAALVLEDGTRLTGDLFIDCTGFRSLLLGQTLGTPFEDWGKWLPTNSAWATQSEGVGDAYPYTRAIAHGGGWQWRIPLQHRMGAGFVYASDHMEAQPALDQFLATLEGRPLRDPFPIRFRTGRHRQAWVGNCVGIGLAGGFVEPLESTTIHLIMIGITRLLQLFPFSPDCAAQRERFNELSQNEIERVRDFIILHYHLTERDDTSFWQYMRNLDVPDTLRERMEAFAQGAQAWQSTNEIFRVDSWIQVLLGQRMTPQGWNRVGALMKDGRLKQTMEDASRMVANRVATMQSHQQFIDSYCAPKEG
ncbi:FAD-dependent oxidoreductase [Croceibacterium sp. LX-88]|uniref:FAD-dependent oxidoreductase n=1 Tax=Croceibacterium selenioxidans TaxID=2838833 RepID=A0ABS5W7U5_9SPHN|nr:tryptophan halogenase family protein [Croceibacterium selenioxidans]MBT2134454.1 FAD-dependent oxidoreductase [Croceibacterium selenioxidans]